jgi:DNA-directed RNA polymerase specialized sigma subunit
MGGKGAFNRRLTDEQIKIFHKLRQEGRTLKEIGERFGVGPSTVSNAIKRYLESLKSEH